MQLDGTLDTFPLRELIEMVIYSSVTGVLELHANGDVAQLFFRDGQPYHAVAGELVGGEAVGAMFEERDAPFRFVADRETTESTLWADPWELLDRAEEHARRWAAIRARVSSMESVPALRQVPSTDHIQISEAAWPVLAAVNGQRSIQDIASHLSWVLLDTCNALLTLIDGGLIVLQEPSVAVRSQRAAASTSAGQAGEPTAPSNEPARSPTNGFLERLLAEAQAKEQRPDLTDDEAQDRKRVYRYVDDRR